MTNNLKKHSKQAKYACREQLYRNNFNSAIILEIIFSSTQEILTSAQ
jgi:hypothetical protein